MAWNVRAYGTSGGGWLGATQSHPVLPGLRRGFDFITAVAKLQGMNRMSARLANAFVRNVRERMTDQGLSQTDLARRMKVTPSFVSQMLSGHRRPGLESLEDFAKALGCEASGLLAEKNFARSA